MRCAGLELFPVKMYALVYGVPFVSKRFPRTKTILRRSDRNCGDDSFSSRRFLLRMRTISGVW